MPNAAPDREFNPYAAPTSDPGGDALLDLYRTDSRKFTYGEWWRMAQTPLTFVIAAVLKTIRVPLRRNFAMAYPHELAIVAWEDVAPYVREKWQSRLEQCEEAGFRRVFCYRLPCYGITREVVCCVLLSDDRLYTASLIYVRAENAVTVREVARFAIGSGLADGRLATTVDYRGYLDPPPDRVLKRVLRTPFPEMLRRHQDWLAWLGASPIARAPQDLPGDILKNEQSFMDYKIQRGLFIRITERELEQIERRGRAETPPEVLNSRLYRLLRGTERACFVLVFVALGWNWIAPVRFWEPLSYRLFRLGLPMVGLAGFWVVKLIQFLLKRSRSSSA